MKGGALVIVCVAFLLGSCLGNKTASPEVDFVEVERTKVVHPEPLPPEVRTEYVLSDNCLAAIKYSDRIARAADRMYKKTDEQLAIISSVREAIASGESLNSLENQQRALQSNMIGQLYNSVEAVDNFEVVYADCKEDMK